MNYSDFADRLYDLKRLAEIPVLGEKSGNATSYDRASHYDAAKDQYVEWGANADGAGFIRMEGRDAVAADLEGPGVIWHIFQGGSKVFKVRLHVQTLTKCV